MDNQIDRAHVGQVVVRSVIAPARGDVTPPQLSAQREETRRMPLAPAESRPDPHQLPDMSQPEQYETLKLFSSSWG